VARAFKRKGDRYVARLEEAEREVVVGLLQQTQELLAPAPREPTGDPFDDLVARLGLPRLDDSVADTPQTQDDPAMERLLPAGHHDDPAMAAEFRRLTQHGLRERKTANLATAISVVMAADGDKVWLDQEQAQAMVVALTDVRLLLGERLGLRTDDDADALQDRLEAAAEDAAAEDAAADDAAGDDPQLYLAVYYDFMTWLQESLTQALMS
jgi:hypothetical protein